MSRLELVNVFKLRGEGKLRSDGRHDLPAKVEVDSYTGTWNLSAGGYRFELEAPEMGDSMAIVKPTKMLEEVGAVFPERLVTEQRETLTVTVFFPQGAKIDEGVEVAEVERVSVGRQLKKAVREIDRHG